MNRLLLILTFIILSFIGYGVYLSQTSYEVVSVRIRPERNFSHYDYRGAINVHSALSLGSGTPQEIAEEARRVGLDFLILTDVNQFTPTPSLNGYYNGLLFLNEAEFTHLDSRLFYISQSRLTDPDEISWRLTDLLTQRETVRREPLLWLSRPYFGGQTWVGSFPPGIEGLEIINPKVIASNAWDRSKIDVLWSLLIYPFQAKLSFLRLFREPTAELSLWDELAQQRKVTGFAGVDASARAIPWSNSFFRFPSYGASFEIASNHIIMDTELTGQYLRDRTKIVSALKNGTFYFALNLLGNPAGFIAQVHSERGQKYHMGTEFDFSRGQVLRAVLPREPRFYYEMVLFKNGVRIATSNDIKLEAPVDGPGVYRVIVRVSVPLGFPDGRRWFTWIYSNPFFIREKGQTIKPAESN